MGHDEQRRRRIMEELEKVGHKRLQQEKERLLEYLEEEENEKRTVENEEAVEKDGPAASSAGG